MLLLAVRNDCPDLIEHIIINNNFEYGEKLLYECFEIACRLDELKVIKKLLPHLKKLSDTIEWSYQYNPVYFAIMYETKLETIQYVYYTIGASINDVNENRETLLFAAVEFKCNIKTINFLCEKGADPNKYNINKDSPWTIAVKDVNDEVIKYFLSNYTTLDHKNMVEIIKAYYNDPENYDLNQKVCGKLILHLAIEEQNVAFCKFLIDKGADVESQDLSDLTALVLAQNKEKKFDFFKMLLNPNKFVKKTHYSKFTARRIEENNVFNEIFKEVFPNVRYSGYVLRDTNKATINQKDENGNTLLHLAARNDDEKKIIDLLEQGAYYNTQNNNGETPEFAASRKNKIILNEINQYFHATKNNYFIFTETRINRLKQRVTHDHRLYTINVKDNNGKTLLHYAVKMNNLQNAGILLDFHNINERDSRNRTPVYYAIKKNHVEMLRLLLKKKIVNLSMLINDKKYDEIEQNECKIMIYRLKKCLNFVFNDESGSLKDELECIKNNHDFNAIIFAGSTEVMCIGRYALKYSDILLYLLQKGVLVQLLQLYIEIKSSEHWSLHYNIKISKISSVLIQIAEYVSSKKYTPESIINFYNWHFTEALSYITANRHDADKVIANVRFEFENIHGGTLLHIAAIVDDEKIAEWLIKEKIADPYLKDHDDNDVYDLAKKHNAQNVLSVLEQIRKNTNLETPS